MILDIILIALLVFMVLYGCKKGFIGIVAKLVSVILAFILAYFLSNTVGNFVANTSWGISIKEGIGSAVVEKIGAVEQNYLISTMQDKLGLVSVNDISNAIADYLFTGIGFVIVFVIARLVLWAAQKILESIFELPVLKTFNKLGGIVMAIVLFAIEIGIILAVIKSVSTIPFMSRIVNIINSSVITKTLYDHNIITNLILSKII